MVENKGSDGSRGAAPSTAWSRFVQNFVVCSAWLSGIPFRVPGKQVRLAQSHDAAYPEIWLERRNVWQRVAILALLTGVYFVAGKAGLMLANQNVSVSLVWPATGMAIAALLLLGQRVWPAIATGRVPGKRDDDRLPRLVSWASPPAIRSKRSPARGWSGAGRTAGGRSSARRTSCDLHFWAALLATMVSATIGVDACAWRDWRAWGESVWFSGTNWWLGDGVGAVIMTPLIVLLITQPRPRWTMRQWIEAGLLFSSLFCDQRDSFRRDDCSR